MITHLASPAVCVIDDEEQDYRPILNALLRIGIGCVHVKGNEAANLPREPFTGLRLVFMDLHLSGGKPGKTTATHAARVFSRVVKPDSLPVVVVIWSKYANERPTDDLELPIEDQPREAELFKSTLFEFFPELEERLVFVEMPKPYGKDRPEDELWTETLEQNIAESLKNLDAFDVLWKWEFLLRETGGNFNGELAKIASTADRLNIYERNEDLKLLLRTLAHEQGGPDCTPTTAHRHMASVLSQTLADHLEHSFHMDILEPHGTWLSSKDGVEQKKVTSGSGLNSLLLAASYSAVSPFVPGTVFQVTSEDEFQNFVGVPTGKLSYDCYRKVDEGGWAKAEWKSQVRPVFVELTPDCDVQQGNRCQALLVAGLIVPAEGRQNIKKADFIQVLPKFKLRWPLDDFEEQDVVLLFCSRYKITMNATREPSWIKPWFRLRELPTASLRNWQASHSSRVGYVSF